MCLYNGKNIVRCPYNRICSVKRCKIVCMYEVLHVTVTVDFYRYCIPSAAFDILTTFATALHFVQPCPEHVHGLKGIWQ